MDKILTIIIPTYNMEHYLRKCVESLILDDVEMFKLLDIIVVNDGSKDASSSIAHEYEKKFPDIIRVIDKINENYGSCINCGLKYGRGKYVKVLDSDDYFDSKSLEYFINKISHLDVDLILSNYNYIDSEGTITGQVSYPLEENRIFTFGDLYYDNSLLPIEMHAVTYKRKLLADVNYKQTEGISYTDQEWIFVPMLSVKNFAFVDVCLYQYLIGREGQTVDLGIYHKKVADRIIGAVNMIKAIQNLKSNPEEIYNRYAHDKLFLRVKAIYYSCLYVNRNDELLKGFDLFLKTNMLSIYEELYSVKLHPIIGCRYIKRWRMNLSAIPIYIRLIMMVLCKVKQYLLLCRRS